MQKSLTFKLLLIFGLALLLWIPITMVSFKVDERQSYQHQAEQKVAQSWTGPQRFVTPVLMIPYKQEVLNSRNYENKKNNFTVNKKLRLVSPIKVEGQVHSINTIRKKGIYKIPVYSSEIDLQGVFAAEELNKNLNEIKTSKGFAGLGKIQLKLFFSDTRGIDSTPFLKLNGVNTTLHIAKGLDNLASALVANITAEQLSRNEELNFTLNLKLRGMSQLSFVPIADNAKIQLSSDWPHPEFIGASLPAQRKINDQGFTADWHSSKFSNNNLSFLRSCLRGKDCYKLDQAAAGASFIDPVNVYLQSERSIKYAMLFIGLSFISFFIFEHIKKTRIHPIQYTFVGLAIAVFYLLLISLAEHIAFYWAYLIGALACSGLLMFYVRFILGSVKSASLFTAMILGLYALLYVIVQAEDFALLMGAGLVFAVLSCLMIFTRNIDWYGIHQVKEDPDKHASS